MECTFQRLSPVLLKDIWILDDTVFSVEKLRFFSSHTHIAKLGFLQFSKRIAYCAPKKWRKINSGIWVIDEWSGNYFHWMTDCLPRIWEGIELTPDRPILLPESYKKLTYVVQSLELLQLKVEFFSPNENLKVANLTLTSRTSTFPNLNEPLTRKTRDFLSLKPERHPWRVIYISRKLALKRKAHNEQEVEVFLQKKGVEIIYAENLSLYEQIKLMSETRVLICLHGAALTNMLFLPPTSKVVELRNVGDSITQCFFNLASALGVSYYYTLNAGDSKDTIMTNFTIDLDGLDQVVDLIG